MKRTICLDFDGVCNTYDGWKGEEELFEPRIGVGEFIKTLISSGKKVAVFSTRPPSLLEGWFIRWLPWTLDYIHSQDLIFPTRKPPADCYVDDRAVRFNGSFEQILPEVMNFKAFWEEQSLEEAVANGQESVSIDRSGRVKVSAPRPT